MSVAERSAVCRWPADDDPAVERHRAVRRRLAAAQVAFLEQADSGHIGQGLADAQVSGLEWACSGPEEVQRPDDLVTEPHRQGLDRAESGLGGGGREPGPPLLRPGQVGGGD
jgi:hypothetical protein